MTPIENLAHEIAANLISEASNSNGFALEAPPGSKRELIRFRCSGAPAVDTSASEARRALATILLPAMQAAATLGAEQERNRIVLKMHETRKFWAQDEAQHRANVATAEKQAADERELAETAKMASAAVHALLAEVAKEPRS